MKKNILYSIIGLAIGLGIGYLFFASPSQEQAHTHQSDGQMWTCSMHPQIMQSEPGECPLCGMDLTPVEAHDNTVGSVTTFHMTENAMALANIQTTLVGASGSESNAMVLSGKIKANEKKVYTQPAHYNARIEKLYVKTTGETVHKGQAIAQVYSPELISAQQELLTAYKMKEEQPGLYKAVRNKFRNWMISDQEINAVIQSGEIKRRFTIHSHISGIVSEVNVTEGSHVQDGNAIFTTADLESVWAVFDAYERQIPMLEKGQTLSLVTNAYPGRSIEAIIDYIDPLMNSTTRTVEVRAILENKDHSLKPGMFVKANVEHIGDEKQNKIWVPATAVLWTGKRSLVYVKKTGEQPTFEMRQITTGAKNDGNIQVLSGLEPGEEIVTQGTFTVDAAAQLNGKTSMMTPE